MVDERTGESEEEGVKGGQSWRRWEAEVARQASGSRRRAATMAR